MVGSVGQLVHHWFTSANTGWIMQFLTNIHGPSGMNPESFWLPLYISSSATMRLIILVLCEMALDRCYEFRFPRRWILWLWRSTDSSSSVPSRSKVVTYPVKYLYLLDGLANPSSSVTSNLRVIVQCEISIVDLKFGTNIYAPHVVICYDVC